MQTTPRSLDISHKMESHARKQYPFLTLDPLSINDSNGLNSPGFMPMSAGLLSPPLTAGPKSPRSPLSPRSPSISRILHRVRSITSLGTKTQRRTDGDGAYKVPPEVWLKVFINIPLYLLPPVTLACRAFCLLAQPLMFSTISTHPPAAPSRGLRPPQPSKYRKRVAERVEFFFSPQISTSVVECWISPSAPEEDGAPADDLIDTIFASLSRLPNLKVLGCRFVRLTPTRLAVLQRLHITTISLESCFGEISDFAVAPSVPLQAVTIKYQDAALSQDKANPCLLFLSPNHLEQLHATTTSILPTLSRSHPFRKLRTLDIPVESIASDLFIPALARCPAVEHISLHTTEFVPRSLIECLPEGVLPNLSSYRGPHHFAATFLRGRTARKLDISLPCKPQRLETSLKGVDRRLESLSFLLEGVELPSLLVDAIHRSFPALKSLVVHEPALSSADINSLLSAVPRHYTLEQITLHIQGRDKFNLWIPPDEAAADAQSCFQKVRAALLTTYPALQAVRFLHGAEGASVCWRRSTLSGLFVQSA
ncbi:hypothetical protein B0H15DRAFT_838446 [Mycena belliarum]|uniref:F-box domain-containing protein n=1 Tax=Mycena belliarum TaxID=1033014 RepID=A0AAD6XN71_9AGAR|nr:hypothetical protein B0H15DRAFT_838446 [Mycena belliae]